jgi:hypothetical protein
MRNFRSNQQSRPNEVQRSGLPDVICRLNEIRRRLARSPAWCDDHRPRHLIEQAEHEVFRSLQLLEAEANRPPASNAR